MEVRAEGGWVGNDEAAGHHGQDILERFSDLDNNPHEGIAPYEEFSAGGKSYYFTPGGFLYRKDPGTEEAGGFFCGYLTDEVWRYRISVW